MIDTTRYDESRKAEPPQRLATLGFQSWGNPRHMKIHNNDPNEEGVASFMYRHSENPTRTSLSPSFTYSRRNPDRGTSCSSTTRRRRQKLA